jgi:hypothetical protein
MKISEFIKEEINPNVFKRGFEQVKTFGKYTMVATPGRFLIHQKFGEPSEQFAIKVFTGNNQKNQVGWVNFEIKDNHLEALDLYIDAKHRRRGIATAMYKFAKELGNDIAPSNKQTALGKAFWATKSPVDEFRVNEAEEDTPAAEEIYSTLERNGYELLGSGVDATVWAKKGGTDVLKIIMPQHGRGAGSEAETFYKFYEFCKQHQNLENLPRFVRIGGDTHSVFTADNHDYIMIGMERLSPIPHGSFAEAMVWILSDLASSGLGWEQAWDTIRNEKTWDTWELDDPDSDRSAPVMATADVLYTIDSWDEQDAAKWGVLYTLMSLLYHTGRINKQAWDLHTENAMMRGSDMIVITDPWIAQSVE